MTIAETVPMAVKDEEFHYIQWGPAIAGALAAAALAFVLDTFAAAIGLGVSSTAPTWRDASMALQLLSGLYLILVAIVAFGVGGYMAGRMRAPILGSTDEIEFRDGTHGLLVWAIALVLTALMTWAVAQSLTRLAAPSGGPTGTAQSVAGENLIAFDLDRLFRAERRPQNTDMTYARSEAGRILLTSTGHSGVTPEDRAYLIRLTSAVTGVAAPDAEKRVDAIIAQARDNIRRARRAAVILAFMAGAAALVGAAVAWFAACAGGQHRDGKSAPSMTWGMWGPRLAP
ncbi:MAG: hypothetical protein E6G96_20165 [Alphaproteobacteria bacterium]|nr:MAG: hypothetical protein E6G96_20165 [Alphaproteobacteria bacterium]